MKSSRGKQNKQTNKKQFAFSTRRHNFLLFCQCLVGKLSVGQFGCWFCLYQEKVLHVTCNISSQTGNKKKRKKKREIVDININVCDRYSYASVWFNILKRERGGWGERERDREKPGTNINAFDRCMCISTRLICMTLFGFCGSRQLIMQMTRWGGGKAVLRGTRQGCGWLIKPCKHLVTCEALFSLFFH